MNVALVYATVGALGTLAFFEPCTIATHTLFSARAHSERGAARWQSLLALWVIRSALIVGLLALAVAVFNAPHWPRALPSLALGVMASVYLASRVWYIPVPHLAFNRLLPPTRVPHRAGLRQAVELGLTLPACTLPLFIIVAALLVTLGSLRDAVAAGLLFAFLFTLPTAISAIAGVGERGRRFLRIAALATPVVTASLLYGGAVWLWVSR